MISLLEGDFVMAKDRALEQVENAIHLIRGERVMLDSALAHIYGVTTKRLNEQLRRNAQRFPSDFAFQLTREELTNLRSQIATSSLHGGKRKLPWAFTEHGAIMLASVLKSSVAIAASVRVVRAFVRLRQLVSTHGDLVVKLVEIERRLDGHDENLDQLFVVLRKLLEQPEPPPQPLIGFSVREDPPPYGASCNQASH